ncbi:MAG: dihydrolipoyl dehydrogenase [Thaumarchaeota archaeon]|nr:dihydrolipoyl dehydrogenase [Nitrososphaerota archaeon]
MKQYDLIVVGTGSAMNIVDPMLRQNPKMKIAVIDKDEPGGICLTRGCIPSKILLYPAELVRTIESARELGVEAKITRVDFLKIMNRMRTLIDRDIEAIREGLTNSESIDYFHAPAAFVAPYTMKVAGETIMSKLIFLATGSKAIIPPVKGLEEVGYLTSDTAFQLTELPESIAIIGGGYIAAEFGFFFASMGSNVTIVGRNPRFVPEEEPEVSELARRKLAEHIEILTNTEVKEAKKGQNGHKILVAEDRKSGKIRRIEASEVMVAVGRGPTNEILEAEKGGVRLTDKGWIQVNEYLETTQPNVWALGDADGKYLFRHVANYESEIVYYNAVLRRKVKVDYHAIPHAIFTDPEIASVGLREEEAVRNLGRDNVLIGFYKYEDTAKGEAMNVKDFFVKVIVEQSSKTILGAHIIGPQASILIQEIINVMYTTEQTTNVVDSAIHIHPALSEVVQRAFGVLMPVDHYHKHVLQESGLAA